MLPVKKLQRAGEEGVRPEGWGRYSDIFIFAQARVIFRGANLEFQYFWGFSER